MSFSIDLWHGFDVIKSGFSSIHKKIKQILDILTIYSSLQKEYCKGLEDLHKEIKDNGDKDKDIQNQNSLLDESLLLLLSSLKEESEKYKNYYNNVNKIIDQLKEALDKMNFQKYFTENIQNTESFNSELSTLISRQEEYNKSFKELCICLAENEANKILKNNPGKELIDNKNKKVNKKNNPTIIDYKTKIDSLLEVVLDNKNEYLDCLVETDKEREKFNKKTEDILINLQKQFKTYICMFQNSINNFIKDKINTYNDIIEINKENEKNNYSKINYKTQILDFVTKNATKIFPMNKLEFIPYKLNKNEIIQKLDKYDLSKNDENTIFNEVKNYINNNKINTYENESFLNSITTDKIKKVYTIDNKLKESKTLDKRASYSLKMTKSNFTYIKDFVFKLCNSNEVSLKNEINTNISEERYTYNNLLFRFMELISINNKDHREYLEFFIKIMSYYRSKGYFILNDSSYKIFVNIFSFILVNYKKSNTLMKNIILLSQTFYKVDKNSNEKIYLLNGLKDHSTFNDIETWHRAINYNLSISIKNNNNYSLNIPNKNEYIKNVNKLAANTIISYLYDLKLSTSKSMVYDEVKKFYLTIYELDEKLIEDQMESIFGDINNVADDKKNKKEKNNENINKEINNNNIKEENKKENNNIIIEEDKKEINNNVKDEDKYNNNIIIEDININMNNIKEENLINDNNMKEKDIKIEENNIIKEENKINDNNNKIKTENENNGFIIIPDIINGNSINKDYITKEDNKINIKEEKQIKDSNNINKEIEINDFIIIEMDDINNNIIKEDIKTNDNISKEEIIKKEENKINNNNNFKEEDKILEEKNINENDFKEENNISNNIIEENISKQENMKKDYIIKEEDIKNEQNKINDDIINDQEINIMKEEDIKKEDNIMNNNNIQKENIINNNTIKEDNKIIFNNKKGENKININITKEVIKKNNNNIIKEEIMINNNNAIKEDNKINNNIIKENNKGNKIIKESNKITDIIKIFNNNNNIKEQNKLNDNINKKQENKIKIINDNNIKEDNKINNNTYIKEEDKNNNNIKDKNQIDNKKDNHKIRLITYVNFM